jgi:rhodanese-related sulfurtransferase
MEFEQVTAAEAISLSAGDSVLLDIREQYEWDAVHAPNAQHLPMSELEARAGELPIDATLLVICHSGQRSTLVTEALVAAGYDAVNVAGGMLGWELAGGDVVRPGSESPLR